MPSIFRRKIVRRILLGAAVVFVAIQAVPVERSNPPVESEVPAPENVRSILRRACYDCHSNETVWLWYSYVAPVSWLIARDVNEGRKELNYSTWGRLDEARRAKKLKETWEEVAEGEMPPGIYLLMHRDAVLSADDKKALRAWAQR
jgi:hypothetical protein